MWRLDLDAARIDARPGVKPERCQAIAKGGQPCSATPRSGRPYCLWHDPQADEARRELSRKGGHARSNASRARKAMKSAADVTPVLWTALNDLAAGTLEPARGQAMASVARALVAVHEATEIEERLVALEAAAQIGGKRA